MKYDPYNLFKLSYNVLLLKQLSSLVYCMDSIVLLTIVLEWTSCRQKRRTPTRESKTRLCGWNCMMMELWRFVSRWSSKANGFSFIAFSTYHIERNTVICQLLFTQVCNSHAQYNLYSILNLLHWGLHGTKSCCWHSSAISLHTIVHLTRSCCCRYF